MMFSTTSAFIIITLAATATALKDAGVYIIGGQPSSVEEYPSIVQVERRDGGKWHFICGGVIISKRTVVSTANQISKKVKPCNLRIRAGSSKYEKGGHIVRVRNYQIHPDFVRKNLTSNIVLLTLRTRLPMSNVIQPAFIVPSGLEVPDNHEVQEAGWGETRFSNHSEVLQQAIVYTINPDECSRRFVAAGYQALQENMICAGILDVGGRYACDRDSGGPLYMDGMLVGLVSSARRRNCTELSLTRYTKVSAFTDWIKSNAD
ncbi:hypothetical protein JYU34_022165 [Plutella xylostella]|uniref:Peptidase S1 domain-containing protein n=1 Tax=Plutella xylostella TaxID=51655 RepID=A0ABQ7PQE2_PLUXY|nr:hypothetical protein JYU34_022165 [Plutella xylostella]